MLIILFLVSHSNFLFVPCGRLSWLPVSFLLHVKYPLSYRIVSAVNNRFFSEPTTTKKGCFQSHPQSTEENALHFTCLACGSLQGSVVTQEYS